MPKPVPHLLPDKLPTLIREKEKNKERCVLGLSTGKSPLKLYAELIRMHREEGLSFRNVVSLSTWMNIIRLNECTAELLPFHEGKSF